MDPLRQPERVAFAGDWHMNARWARNAIDAARQAGADVIVHLGDFGYTFDASFMLAVDTALRLAKIPLLFVDGNHEDFTKLHRYRVQPSGVRKMTDSVWHLPRGFRWSWSGVEFLALGGAHSVDRHYREEGVSWWREEAIGLDDMAAAVLGGPADVLISHDCPAGVTIPGVDDCEGPPSFPLREIELSQGNRERLRAVAQSVKPRMVWHGHHHRRYSTGVDLGWGPIAVNGLDCEGKNMNHNVVTMGMAAIRNIAGRQ